MHTKPLLPGGWMSAEQKERFAETMARERGRLRNFIRRRVADEGDAEDILQEVFYELVRTYQMMQPVEQLGAWLFRVARNRIIDLFRRNRSEVRVQESNDADDEDDLPGVTELLPTADAGPEAAYARRVLLEELEVALGELPQDQREVFLAHEIEGRSFKELAAATGVGVNTLLARKRYAVLSLRTRLLAIYEEFDEL
jgi:RNA polymerase sigma factor (sigma-70 family)